MHGYRSGIWALVVVLSFAGLAAAGEAGRGKRPRLDVRASPRMAFSPVEVIVVAELKGGDDVEDLYCPALEWDWGDGSRSVHESDCSPFGEGTKLDRFFSARHAFRYPGEFLVRLTLRRAGRSMAAASVPVRVIGRTAGLSED